MNVKTFVINLKTEHERRKIIKPFLINNFLDFEFFEAIDGGKENLLKHPDYNGLKRRLLYGKDLTTGELGCYFSHRALLKKIVDNNIPTSLILEDDAILFKDFYIILDRLKQANYPWTAIRFIGKPKVKTYRQRKIERIYRDYFITRLATSPGGAYAYLIKLEGAKKLLTGLDDIYCPNDIIMGFPWKSGLDVLTIQPAIATWNKDLVSAIGDDRFKKNNLMGLEKGIFPFMRGLYKIYLGVMKGFFYWKSFFTDKKYIK